MLNSRQDIKPVQMNAKVGILLLRQHLEDPPARRPTLEGRVGEGLAEDDVDDLLPQEELATPLLLDDARDGGRGGGASLGVGALEVADDGQDLGLAQRR